MVSGEVHSYTEEELNKRYLNNEIISFWDMQYAFQNVDCTHNEVKFYFKKL